MASSPMGLVSDEAVAVANWPMDLHLLVVGRQDAAKVLLALEDVEGSVVDPIVQRHPVLAWRY